MPPPGELCSNSSAAGWVQKTNMDDNPESWDLQLATQEGSLMEMYLGLGVASFS